MLGKKEPKSPEQKFMDSYNKLVKKSGYQLSVAPMWVQTKEGGFVTVTNVEVVKVPPTE